MVVNLRTLAQGWRSDPRYVYIGRPSKWGNPFPGARYGRTEAIARHKAWIATQPELLAALPELRGKLLVCFCAPLACHGDTLLALSGGTDA